MQRIELRCTDHTRHSADYLAWYLRKTTKRYLVCTRVVRKDGVAVYRIVEESELCPTVP